MSKKNVAAYERRRKFITEIHADLVFRVCISFMRCFKTSGIRIEKIPVCPGIFPCLARWWPQIMQTDISFRSRSDLGLDADHLLDCLGTYLVLQACTSFSCVSDKSGAFLFLPCSHKTLLLGGQFSVKWCGLRLESQSDKPSRSYKTNSQSYGWARIRTASPRKGTRMGFTCFYRKPPLKPFWIHLNKMSVVVVALGLMPKEHTMDHGPQHRKHRRFVRGKNQIQVLNRQVLGFGGPTFLNCGSRFASIRIATCSQRFQIARFESQGQKPLESLLRFLYFSLLR